MPTAPTVDPRRIVGNWVSLAGAVALGLPWTFSALLGLHPAPPITALLGGLSILGAAFLLSWGVETAELDVPPALAVSVLALVAVLPEYAVDATFAWKAATDTQQAHYAIANMTGGNRLLLGIGWSVLVFLAWGRYGRPGIRLPTTARADVAVLLMASLYALVVVIRGAITLVDTAVLVALYAVYVTAAIRGASDDAHEEPDLVGPSALLGAYSAGPRRALLLLLLIWATASIFIAAEPFAHALVQTGLEWGIDEFLLVQWLAPLASESPELAVASLLVLRGHLAKGMLTLVSSKVNQWTLLVGTLPVVTSVAAGSPSMLPMDDRQREEVLLTLAQSLFGVAVISNLFLSRLQAILLATLFLGQFLVPDTRGRVAFAIAYLVAGAAIVLSSRSCRRGLAEAFAGLRAALLGRPA